MSLVEELWKNKIENEEKFLAESKKWIKDYEEHVTKAYENTREFIKKYKEDNEKQEAKLKEERAKHIKE